MVKKKQLQQKEDWKSSNLYIYIYKGHIDLPYSKDDNLIVWLVLHTSEQDIRLLTACHGGWRPAPSILFLRVHHWPTEATHSLKQQLQSERKGPRGSIHHEGTCMRSREMDPSHAGRKMEGGCSRRLCESVACLIWRLDDMQHEWRCHYQISPLGNPAGWITAEVWAIDLESTYVISWRSTAELVRSTPGAEQTGTNISSEQGTLHSCWTPRQQDVRSSHSLNYLMK